YATRWSHNSLGHGAGAIRPRCRDRGGHSWTMPAPSRPDPARLAAIIVEMRRALRRSLRPADQDEAGTGRAAPAPPSPPSPLEAEVVRFVAAHPGAGTSAIARALRLRPNTVSGLCSTLVRSGVLRREQDPRDRRAARFQLTD